MKYRWLACRWLTCWLVGCLCAAGCAKGPELFGEPAKPVTAPEEVRALSLKALQTELRNCQPQRNCSAEVLSLAGLKTVWGVVADEAQHDLILFGQAAPEAPPLLLEDFAVALRNAWLKYARVEGNTRYYALPGCSIDPEPRVMQGLQQIEQRLAASHASSETERALSAWRSVCLQPQNVRVMGIPFTTHFAQVMVKADYDMKSLADGTDVLDPTGLVSLTSMALREASSAVLQRQPLTQSVAGLNRFWFYPGETLFEEEQGAYWLKQCPVKLLTEEMYSSASGESLHTGTANPRAQKFAENFTALYAKVMQLRPVYQELENLFRFVALAGLLKSKHENVCDLGYLLEAFAVPAAAVPQKLPGRAAVKDWSHTETQAGGSATTRLWFPSCGGVDIAIDERLRKVERNSTGKLAGLGNALLAARPSADALAWNYRETDRAFADLKNGARLGALNQTNRFNHLVTVRYKPDGYEVSGGETNDPFYTGRDLAKLGELLRSKLGTASPKDLNFDFEDFPGPHKEQAFLTTYGIENPPGGQQPRAKPSSRSQPVLPAARELLHTPGVRYEAESSRIEQETTGERQGWFKLTMNFLVQVKKEVVRVSAQIWFRTHEQAAAYLAEVQAYFSGSALQAESLEDSLTQIDRYFLRKFPGVEVHREYENQYGRIQISWLHRDWQEGFDR